MLDQEVTNHHFIDINGTVFNVPLNKALMLAMLFFSIIIIAYLNIDGKSITSILTNVGAALSILFALFTIAQMVYSNDHLLASSAINWTFKDTRTYELNLNDIDELFRSDN